MRIRKLELAVTIVCLQGNRVDKQQDALKLISFMESAVGWDYFPCSNDGCFVGDAWPPTLLKLHRSSAKGSAVQLSLQTAGCPFLIRGEMPPTPIIKDPIENLMWSKISTFFFFVAFVWGNMGLSPSPLGSTRGSIHTTSPTIPRIKSSLRGSPFEDITKIAIYN